MNIYRFEIKDNDGNVQALFNTEDEVWDFMDTVCVDEGRIIDGIELWDGLTHIGTVRRTAE